MKINKYKKLFMGTDDASKLWGLSQDHIKKLCRIGKCEAFKIGVTWVLLKDQPNPKNKTNDVESEKYEC